MSDEKAPAEYPKMLYKGGAPYSDDRQAVPHHQTLVVNDAEEEAAAAADGFAAAEHFPAPVEAGEETTAGESTTADAGEEPLSGGAGADSIPA